LIHFRSISRVLGILLLIEAGMLLLCAIIPLLMHEQDFFAFTASALITICTGGILVTIGKKKGKAELLSRRDGYVIVSLSWIMFSLCGCLPFIISGVLTGFTDAFFETMAGFTTTGVTVIGNMDSMPHGILFWRSLTEWIGGLGIVFFTVVVLPVFGVGHVQLFAAETTGPTRSRPSPRISVSGRWILAVYILMTIACAMALKICGLSIFDSVNYALSTLATGGGYTRAGGVAGLDSIPAEVVIMFFMFAAGINFNLLYMTIFRLKLRDLGRDEEFRWYMGSVIIIAVVISIGLVNWTDMGPGESFRHAAFQTISIITTTGFTTTDYNLWPLPLAMVLGLSMYLGACAGSTSCAMKSIRSLVLFKIMRNEFRRILHPSAVLPVRVNGKVLSDSSKQSILSFSVIFIGLIFVSWLIFMFMGLDMDSSYGFALASICNVGVGPGGAGMSVPWNVLSIGGKWFASLLMFVGRLEIFAVLILLSPSFWKRS